ncbi:MAG: glycosyltransferase family 2 protein [Mailhella sp.]|nr:glycosyltransferase family 2 protein [Mailhella sp.]
MPDDLISIIIPVYNVEAYLDACLRSAREQTYGNIEILAVDDCSTDASVSVIERHMRDDPRVRLFRHDRNRKQGAARNTGMRHAKGRFYMFLDADDTLPHDAAEKLHRAITSSGAQVVMGKMLWNSNGRIYPVEYIDKAIDHYLSLPDRNIQKHNKDTRRWNLCPPTNKIYDAGFLKGYSMWFPEDIFWEDMVFGIQLYTLAERMTAIPDFVYVRTERNDAGNPSTTQHVGRKKIEDRETMMELILVFLIRQQHSGKISAEECRKLSVRLLSTTERLVRSVPPEDREWAEEWFLRHKPWYKMAYKLIGTPISLRKDKPSRLGRICLAFYCAYKNLRKK